VSPASFCRRNHYNIIHGSRAILLFPKTCIFAHFHAFVSPFLVISSKFGIFFTQKTRRTICTPHRYLTEASPVFICLNLTPYSPKYRPPSHLGCWRLVVCPSIFTRRTISYAFDLSFSKSTLANLSHTTSNTYSTSKTSQ
jgi:hypothetical protein